MSKIIMAVLLAATICLGIGLKEVIYERNDMAGTLSVVQSEATSLKSKLDKKTKELSAAQNDLKSKIAENKKLKSDLEIANKTIEDVKDSGYELIYLGEFKYTYYCDERIEGHICGGSGVTASGAPTEVGVSIAVDPSVIPLGTKVYIEGVGYRIAQDTGSAVKGKHIDILVTYHDEALAQTIVNGGVWILL